MTKWLAVLLWPAGVAVIFCAAALLARRSRPVSAAASPQSSVNGHSARGGGAAAGHRDLPPASRRIIRFFLLVLGGAAVIYGVMVLLALAAVHGGPVIDKPIFHWTATHQLAHWTKEMKRATEVGDRYPIWAAGAMAAVCMAITWRRDRWLPPVAIGTALVLARYLTRAINHTVHRVPPPGAGGIFPSGGCARAVFIYGLIGYLLWREFGGATPAARRRAAIWTGAVVAALAFNEGYSRGYLAVHWFTDICGGLIYGCLLLYLFITAVRLTAGPAPAPAMAADRTFAHAPRGGVHVRRGTRPEHVNAESWTAQSVSASGGE
jgi:membrane-associated phospholipid phosphatase